MANNPSLYNAALSGASGGAQSRWLTDPVAANYLGFRTAAIAFATAVDAAIPVIVGGASSADNQLLASICQGAIGDRLISSPTSGDYTDIAAAIAALFTENRAGLDPAGTGTLPLSRAWWVDLAADPTKANGSAETPYAHPNAALVAAVAAGLTSITLLIVAGDYSVTPTAVDTSGVLRAVTLSGQGQSVGYVTQTPQIELGSLTWLCNVNGGLLTVNDISISTGNTTVDTNGALSGFNVLTANNSSIGFIDNVAKLLGVVLVNSVNGGGMVAGGTELRGCTVNGTLNCSITTMVDCSPGGGAPPDIGTLGVPALCFNFRNSTFNLVEVQGDNINIDNCTVGMNGALFTMGVNATAQFTNSLMSQNPSTATLTAGTGFVFDSFTYQSWLTNAGVLTAGQIFTAEFPQFADISVAVPAIAANALDYLDVTLVGTALEGLIADSPILVNPKADIEAAGAGLGGLIYARVSALNTVRLAFKGQTTAHAVDMRFSRVG